MLNLKKLLANILEELITSTVLVPLNTSLFSHYATSSDHLQVSKCGDICHITGIVKNNSTIANGGEDSLIGTIPDGYRPKGRYVRRVMHGSGTATWLCVILTDGRVLIERYSNTTSYTEIPSGAWLVIDTTYNCNMTNLI